MRVIRSRIDLVFAIAMWVSIWRNCPYPYSITILVNVSIWSCPMINHCSIDTNLLHCEYSRVLLIFLLWVDAYDRNIPFLYGHQYIIHPKGFPFALVMLIVYITSIMPAKAIP